MLGDMYRFGQGVTENLEEAVKHYKTGAEQGANLLKLVLMKIICAGRAFAKVIRFFESYIEQRHGAWGPTVYQFHVSESIIDC